MEKLFVMNKNCKFQGFLLWFLIKQQIISKAIDIINWLIIREINDFENILKEKKTMINWYLRIFQKIIKAWKWKYYRKVFYKQCFCFFEKTKINSNF